MSKTILETKIRNLKSLIKRHSYYIKKYNLGDDSVLVTYVKSYQEDLKSLEFIRDTLCQN